MQWFPKRHGVIRRWLLTVAVGGIGLLGGPATRADVLSITAPSNQSVQLRLQGVANKDYVIQTATDLTVGNWTTLSTGATDATGQFQTSDTGSRGTMRCYRAVRLPGLQPTTTSAATVPNNTVTVTLNGSDPLDPGGALSAVITQLPAAGVLEQMDGTPITTVGTVVSDAHNRVLFVAAGAAAAFGYQLERASNGVTSASQTVAVTLSPKWVYSSFDDATQQLQLSYSLDGILWNNTGDLYTAPSGDGVRDSSITYLNGVYYVAYTAGNFGLVPYVQIARSTDLVHWTYLCSVDTSTADTVNYSWAPEWFVDQDGSVYLYLTRETNTGAWRIFWTRPTSADLTTWAPIQMVGGDMTGRGAIDPQVVRDGDTYYLLYRNYGPAGSSDYIEMAKGTSPTSFTLYKTGDWAGWGTPREGPDLVHLGGSNWRIYFYLVNGTLGGSPVARSDSTDNMATWTAAAATGLPSHGTCILLDGATNASLNIARSSAGKNAPVSMARPGGLER